MKNKAVAFAVFAAGAVVAQGLMPVVAHATTQVTYAPTTISMTGQATLHPQHVVANDPWSGKSTSWVPVYYLQEALKSVGVQAKWNGSTLSIGKTPNGWKVNVAGAPSVGNPPAGQMQFSIGAVQDDFLRAPKLVAKDPSSGVDTTYIPVYYADLFLKQRLMMGASWNGSQWSLIPQNLFNGINEQSYSSATAAGNDITSLEQSIGLIQYSPQTVNLGSGISAKWSGGAGQYKFQWQEGRWTVLAAFSGDDAAGTQVAKDVVAYLHTHMLPAPNSQGTIIITGSTSTATMPSSAIYTTVAWQEGNNVYQLQHNGDPVQALQTVVNGNRG